MVPSSWASLRMEANSADSMALGVSGEFKCEGYLEAASAPWLVFPGHCTMWKRHRRVRCLRRNRQELDISSSVRSPNIFVRGLWSVTMTRLSHPCVEQRVCSRP